MSNVVVSPEVRYRSDLGRFLAHCDEAGLAAVQATVEEGEKLAKQLAPSGAFEDDRGPTIRDSIEPVLAGKVGFVVARARHAMAQEKGARPHQIGTAGQILASEARGFGPRRGPVNHPGNPPQPYMGPMYAILKRKMISIMSRYYPG